MWPQIIYLSLILLGLGLQIDRHGKPKDGTHNIWVDLFSTGLIMLILYWGGFFDVFKSLT